MKSAQHLPPVLSATDAREHGIGARALSRLVRVGDLIQVRPGLYMPRSRYEALTPVQRHVAISIRTAADAQGEFALAGVSAAAVYGLATPMPIGESGVPVTMYAIGHQSGRRRPDLRQLAAPLLASEVNKVQGVVVTSLARTALDLARYQRLPYALIPLDSALRLGACSIDLERMAQRMHRWPGSKVLKDAIPLATPESESALESTSRGVCAEMKLPQPELQQWVVGDSGRRYRVDFFWPQHRLIGEADGWTKLGSNELQWRAALTQAKLRQDDLEAADFRVVRWAWETLYPRMRTIARILGATVT